MSRWSREVTATAPDSELILSSRGGPHGFWRLQGLGKIAFGLILMLAQLVQAEQLVKLS